jgi:hypothetical protein
MSKTNRIKAVLTIPVMFGAVRKLTGTLHPKDEQSGTPGS